MTTAREESGKAAATGGCLCGAVRFATRQPLPAMTLCHCAMCRRWHGHLGVYASLPRAAIEIAGEEWLSWFESSPGARRGFCARCGSSLFWEEVAGSSRDIAAGAFDEPNRLKLRAHIWAAHKGDYYAIDDALPQFAESSAP